MSLSGSLILVLMCCSAAALAPYRRKCNSIVTVVVAIVAVIWIAQRDIYIVPDTENYVRNFKDIIVSSSILNVQGNYQAFENGFMALNLIVKKTEMSYRAFFGVVAIIGITLVMKAYTIQIKATLLKKEKSNELLYLALYLGYFGIFYGAIALRSGVAIPLFFLGSAYLLLNKKAAAVICAILAFQFHHSIVIVAAVVFICDRFYVKNKGKFKMWWYIIVIIWLGRVGLILNTLMVKVMTMVSQYIPFLSRYTAIWYTGGVMGDGFLSKKNILFLLIGLILIVDYPQNANENYNKTMTIYMVGLTLTFLLNEFGSGYRLSDMFLIYMIPLVHNMIMNINSRFKRRDRSIIAALIVVTQFVISLRITSIVLP